MSDLVAHAVQQHPMSCHLKNATWRLWADLTGPLSENPAHSRSPSHSATASWGDHALPAGRKYSFRPGGTTRPEKNLAQACVKAQTKKGENTTVKLCFKPILV